MIDYPTRNLFQIKRFIVLAGIIAAVMFSAIYLQRMHLTFLDIDPRISIFYLPAGIIIISTLVSPRAAPFGLFLGILVANRLYGPQQIFIEDVALSMVSGICALGAVIILYAMKGKLSDLYQDHKPLPDIDGLDVFYFCCIYSFLNTTTHQLLFVYHHAYGVEFKFVQAIGMWFGDLTGAFFVFIALNLGYMAVKRLKMLLDE